MIVTGPGRYGAIAQQGGAPLVLGSGGITRSASLALADAAFGGGSEALTVLGGQGPCYLPAALTVATGGLAVLYGGGNPFPTE